MLTLLLLIGFNTKCNAQYLAKGVEVRVTDSLTDNYYILETSHTVIAAFNAQGKPLWKTNPRIDNSLEEYRHKAPWVTLFQFVYMPTRNKKRQDEVKPYIRIAYSNSQFGDLDPVSGKFDFKGQD